MNAFEIIGLEPALDLDLEVAESAWRERSRGAHPDSSTGDAAAAAEIHEAWNTIKTPASRLRHWLELNQIEIPRAGAISERMMGMFAEVGGVLNEVDAFIAKKKAATTALAKALLTEAEMNAQQTLQAMIAKLQSEQTILQSKFAEIDAAKDFSAGLDVLSQLGFLEKWSAQCRERFLTLATLM